MLDVLIALVRSPLTALRGNRDLALEDLALRVTVQGGSRWRKRRRPIHPEKPAFVLGPPRRVRGYAPRRPCGRARFFGRLDRRFAPGLNGYRCAISSWLPTESSNAPRLGNADRALWVLLRRLWSNEDMALVFVKPATAVRWHRAGFRAFFYKYKPRIRKPPSQTWRTFLKNHASEIAAIDFFVVPTITFRLLYVFIIVSHERRQVLHFNIRDTSSIITRRGRIKG